MLDMHQYTLWNQAQTVYGLNPYYWRQDFRGRLIYRDACGLRYTRYGWEKGHIQAAADGGSDGLWNLQAEHWQTNLEKENERLQRERERKQAAAFFEMLARTLPDHRKATPMSAQNSTLSGFGGGLSALRPYMPEPTLVPYSSRQRFGYGEQTPFLAGLRSYDSRNGL